MFASIWNIPQPKPPILTHDLWAAQQNFWFDAHVVSQHLTNPKLHRCQIGKIALKQSHSG